MECVLLVRVNFKKFVINFKVKIVECWLKGRRGKWDK